ncbi:MAG: homoserine dehydrogenase [Deferribacterota bacterium]|nr:homoserine dehydrogenase [Deferribacterota bacterium]
MQFIKIGIIGYGTVGHGLVKILKDKKDLIRKNSGLNIEILGLADRSIGKKRDIYTEDIELTTNNPREVIENPNIDIVVELIGGIEDAKDIVLNALRKNKHIVTANKALLATYGSEIFELADNMNLLVGFEASVGGGIPIIRVLKEDMCINDIRQIYAILNGTSNYILTKMELEAKEFSDALSDAQKEGYAESDPTYDIEGVDAAQKITLLGSIAFNRLLNIDNVYVEGISKVRKIDIDLANELGGKIKLLAIAKSMNGSIDIRVHPTIIPKRYFLADVTDVYNAVYVRTSKVDRTMHYGKGAGAMPTGNAVASDIISIGKDIVSSSSKRVPIIGYKNDYINNINIIDINEVESIYYLRFTVLDEPNVLSKITGILGKNKISIVSAIQRGEWLKNGIIPLVLITHKTKGKNVFDAVKEIDNKDFVKDKTLLMRIEK